MKIFINQSSKQDLKQLKGVGPVVAARIITEREICPFSNLGDVCHRVPGVSNRTVESWSNQQDIIVTLDQPQLLCLSKAFSVMLYMLLVAVVFSLSRHDNYGNLYIPFLRPLNATAKHTIYFECIEDGDCGNGQECYPAKLHPTDKPFDLSNYRKRDNIWVDSKYGLEPLSVGGAYLISLFNLESGRRCWSTVSEVGADCGEHVHQICNSADNLSCIYGKCRKTNDSSLVEGSSVKGDGFRSKRDMWCHDFQGCLYALFDADRRMEARDPETEYENESEMAKLWKFDPMSIIGAAGKPMMRKVNLSIQHEPFNKKFKFPEEFGIHLVLDNRLTEDGYYKTDTQEEVEENYKLMVQTASSIFEKHFGFKLRLTSICWVNGERWWKDNFFQDRMFQPLRQKADTNIIVYAEYQTEKQWKLGDGTMGFAHPGSIWWKQTLSIPSISSDEPLEHYLEMDEDLERFNEVMKRPAEVRLFHIENYKGGSYDRLITLTHEIAHTFGTPDSWALPKQLGGPYFGNKTHPWSGCSGEILSETIMSYCKFPKREFLNATQLYIHEFMNRRDRYRKTDMMNVYGERVRVMPINDDPLESRLSVLDPEVCKLVQENAEPSKMQDQTWKLESLAIFAVGGVAGWAILQFARHFESSKVRISLGKDSAVKLRQTLTGVGPAIAKRIIEKRPFKDWQDLKRRVKGLKSQLVEDWKNDPGIVL